MWYQSRAVFNGVVVLFLSVMMQSVDASSTVVQLEKDLVRGKLQAQQTADKIKSEEIEKTSKKLGEIGEEILIRNPGARKPAAVMGVLARAWLGTQVLLARNEDFEMRTQFEGRSKSGELKVQSSILNWQLNFAHQRAMNLGLQRALLSPATSAGLSYDFYRQLTTTQIEHALIPHLALTFGAAQSPAARFETSAKISYQAMF